MDILVQRSCPQGADVVDVRADVTTSRFECLLSREGEGLLLPCSPTNAVTKLNTYIQKRRGGGGFQIVIHSCQLQSRRFHNTRLSDMFNLIAMHNLINHSKKYHV